MKNIFKFLVFILCLTLSACSSNIDGEKLYDEAYDKTLSVNDMQYDLNLDIKFDVVEDEKLVTLYEIPFKITIQIKGVQDKNIEYHTHIKTEYVGEIIEQQEWFKDGVAYIDDGYNQYKTALDNEEAYILYTSIQLPKINSFNSLTTSKSGKDTKITMNCTKEELVSTLKTMNILQVTGLDFTMMDDYLDNIEISYITLLVNDDGYISQESFEFSLSENDTKMTAKVNITLSQFNDSTIDSFDPNLFIDASSMSAISKDITLDEEVILVNDLDFAEYGDGICAKEVNGEMRYIDVISKIYYSNEICYDWEYDCGYDVNYTCVYDFSTMTSEGDCELYIDSMKQLKNEYEQLYNDLSLIIEGMKQ